MLDGQAVKEIERLAQQAAGKDTIVEVDGRELSTVELRNPPKEEAPDIPKEMTVHSLQGLVDYIDSNRDELVGAECMVHVVGPTLVRVVSKLQPRAKRFAYLEAKALDLVIDTVGRWWDLEQFIIALQSRYVDVGDRATVLRVLGNVTDAAELHVDDDGFSQQVTTRAGTTGMKDESPVPNPVTLAPYRTFREVEQVSSPFILRMQKGPRVALFEADGGAWELEAVKRIAAWLEGKVGDFAILH